MSNEKAGAGISTGTLELLRVVPVGGEGHPRGSCESCGLYLWSEGGYRVPGLKGLFCSLVCLDCGIAEKTGQKKQIAGAPAGSGARLLFYLKTAAPRIYAQLAQGGEAIGSKRCLECGTPLSGKRADSIFCSGTHKMRFRRHQRSETTPNCQISRNTPIQNTRLGEEQNA